MNTIVKLTDRLPATNHYGLIVMGDGNYEFFTFKAILSENVTFTF